MSAVLQSRTYPAAMDQKLRHLRRRQSALAAVRAFLLGGGALLAGMFVALTLDWYFMLFSSTLRVVLTAAAVGASGATFLIAAVGPLRAWRGLRRSAGEVDQATPQLEERWTTVANFVEANHRPASPIGKAMLQQVTSEAVAMGRLVEPARIATLQHLQRASIWCATTATFVVVFLAVDWQHHRILLQRFWSPWTDITATQLECVSGDLVVPRGEPVELVVHMSGVPRGKATIVLARDGAATEAVALTPLDDQPEQFKYFVASLESSIAYRFQAGDGRTKWHSVTAIDRPALAQVKMTLAAPEYVDREVYEKNYLPAHVQAIQGSHLRLEMKPEAELRTFRLRLSREDGAASGDESQATQVQEVLLTADGDGWYRFEAFLQEDVSITPELLSPHGLTNVDVRTCSIRVLPDRAPIARVISPTEELAVGPDEVVEVRFEAHDDHGIAKAELVVYQESSVEGEPPTILSVEEIPLGDQRNSPHVVATAELDLSKYELGDGTSLSYAVRVTDNRMALQEQPPAETQEMSGNLSASDSKSAADTQAQAADPLAPDTAAVASAEAPIKTNPTREGEAGANEPAKSNIASAPLQTPRDTEALPQAETSPDATEPAAGNKVAEVPDNALPTKDAEVANAAAAGKASHGQAENDANLQELPMSGEVEKQLANASPPASTTSAAAIGGDPRPDPELPGDSQSLPSGDMTSANRQPPMTDDTRRQFAESNRLRLKIEDKTISAAEPSANRVTVQMQVRQRLEEIDRELQPAEEVLSSLVSSVSQSGIADPQIQELHGVDQRLAKVDQIIANLRNESKETPYAFVGLHMVEVGTAHITPARDHVFALIRQPDVDTHGNSAEALHRVNRARELLAELLVRFERVLRDERLAEAIEETAKFYEVYVENLHRFLRAQSKPNPNPLQRKLAIVEVDQEYLDRLREVTQMRRDLMAEFARMLGDDPRLLSKYMDLIKRRQTSLRDRLTELHERQGVIATELSGWLQVDEAQRQDIWMLAAEIRLQDVASLAQEASRLEDRMKSQFPLALDPEARDSAAVLNAARQLAIHARTGAAKARRLLRDPLAEGIDLAADINEMSFWLAELDAALEQLAFNNGDEATADYTDKRLAEGRTLFESIVSWTELAEHLPEHRFPGLAKVDQEQLAFRTELLRIDMAGIDQQLATQFREGVPESVTVLATELKQLMEVITFNQAAAAFELEAERLSEAESQQALALAGFERAETLFDQIRRTVIEELDQVDPEDPNIADLVDPTLDQLLERLEREPDLNALLGLPNRPRNLRVISDFFVTEEGDTPVPTALEEAAEQARQRARKEEAEARRLPKETGEEDDLTEEQWREIANAEEAEQRLQEKIEELKRRAADPQTDPEEAAKLTQMAEQLAQMQQQLAGRQIDKQQWEEMIRSDQMQAVLRAAARGEPLPDSQWNRLMSSLDEGLWQVRRRTPPEEYRQAIEQYQERIRKLITLESTDAQ